eukprot:196469_1
MNTRTFSMQHDQSSNSNHNYRKRAQTMAYKLRNERQLRVLRGSNNTRARSDQDPEDVNKENIHVQVTKSALDDALKTDLAVLSEVTQNTDKPDDNNTRSEFALCNELLNEIMVLRQHDLNSLQQELNSNTHNIDHIYNGIQTRHSSGMQKLQGIIGSNDERLFSTIQNNNQKWLKDVQQFMIKLHNIRKTNGEKSKDSKCYVMAVEGQDIKSQMDEKRKKNVSKELQAMYLAAEIELHQPYDISDDFMNPMELIDAMEARYNRKCLEYDELQAEYCKLKAECALCAMFENEYKKILNELMVVKKMNQKQSDEHKQKCDEYEEECARLKEECKALVVQCDKANDRAEKLQEMYQTEYEKLVQELVTYRQQQGEITKKHDVLSSLMDATKEENEYLMKQLTESKQVKAKLKQIESELNETKANQKNRMEQLEDVYQAEYSKLMTQFTEYKQQNNPQM